MLRVPWSRRGESKIRRILHRRRQKFSGFRDRVSDEETTSFIIVLAAERLPVLETIELSEQLKRSGVNVGCLVVNKRAPANSGDFLDERRAQEEIHLSTLTDAIPFTSQARHFPASTRCCRSCCQLQPSRQQFHKYVRVFRCGSAIGTIRGPERRYWLH